MLQVEHVVKSFGGIRAVDDCSLAVSRGSITGLIGPNGAGKTTLFNIITGFLKPEDGAIWFKGERIDGLPPHEIFHKSLCRTFQIPRELREMTVLENLMVVPTGQVGERIWNSWLRSSSITKQEREIKEKAEEILAFVELIQLKNELAKNLSSGQKKLLELARVLMGDPEMILLDEPGAGVNPVLMVKLKDKILDLCQGGKTFFLIEHDMDIIAYLCDKVIVMNKGAILAEGTPQEIKKDPRVLEAYLGE